MDDNERKPRTPAEAAARTEHGHPVARLRLGIGVDLCNVITGSPSGIFVGIAATLTTGALVYIGYRFILRRGAEAGIGIASATKAGN